VPIALAASGYGTTATVAIVAAIPRSSVAVATGACASASLLLRFVVC
jgi:hypothetical protein